MSPFAVITARSGSKRVPWKNMLPIGGRSISEIAIRQSLDAGLFTVVTSDIQHLLSLCPTLGAMAIARPSELANGDKHIDSIKHAVEVAVAYKPALKGEPVVLLQPTSPFRNGDIIRRCIQAHSENPDKVVFSGRTLHYAEPSGKPVQSLVWDGCVAVYPFDKIGSQEDAIVVENEHTNTLQIDTEEDYIQACVQNWRLSGCPVPIGAESGREIVEALSSIFKGNRATLIGRKKEGLIDQESPVAWLNHCHGWDGGRADALFLVAGQNLTKVGINAELADVALKAKVVVVRDFGQTEWVLSNLKTNGKVLIAKDAKMQVSTGALASVLLKMAGANVERVGFQRGISRIPYCSSCFPTPATSDEIALLEVSGVESKKLV